MRFRRTIYTLVTLISVVQFAQVNAQTKKQTKKTTAAKTVKTVKPAKSAKKTAARKAEARPSAQKATARRLGEVAAKNPVDTTKRGGQNAANNPNNPDKNGGSLSEEIVVTTNYKPVLADAVKIRRNPNLEEATPYKAPLTYTPLDKRLEANSAIKQLDAMKMPPPRDSIPYNNYVKAGLGNIKTTYAEGYFNNGADEGLQYGGWVKHFAQSGSDFKKQNQGKDEVGVFGKNIGETSTLSGQIDYHYQSNYFYGYNANTTPAPVFDPAHEHFNKIGAQGEIASNYRDTDRAFVYALKANGYLFNNAFHAKENNLVLTGFINQTVKQFYAGLGATLDLATQKDSLYSYNNSIFRLNPYLKFQGTNYKIDAGINIADEFGFTSKFYVLPAAKLELQVIPNYVRLFVEAKGDINRSSLLNFYMANPFLGENLQIKNSVDLLDLAAGLKGTLAPGLGFKAFIFRNQVKDMPLLVSNFDFGRSYNRFAVIYDNGTSKVSGFTGELDYRASDDFNLFGQVEFKDYQMASEKQAWNLPKFKLTAGTVIHITDKVNVTGSLLFRGNTYDRLNNGTVVNINSFADLSGGVEYKATGRLSVFVNVNNLLNQNYQTWLYYPDYGFNIFGGAGFKF